MQTATERDVRTTEEPPPWRFCTRVAFRFCFVYLGLFCLTFAQITFAFAGALARWLPEHAVLWQMVLLDAVTRWVGRTVFGTDRLRLTGRLEGRPVTISLQRQSLDDFTLRNRGFRWVQEQPFVG